MQEKHYCVFYARETLLLVLDAREETLNSMQENHYWATTFCYLYRCAVGYALPHIISFPSARKNVFHARVEKLEKHGSETPENIA